MPVKPENHEFDWISPMFSIGRTLTVFEQKRFITLPFFLKLSMTSTPTFSRVKFGELEIGQRFYDPISAEFFVKQTDMMAAMVTGMGDGTVPDEFEADDIVGIEQ